MPIVKNREYRSIINPFDTSPAEKRIQSDFYFEGYATTFDKPYELYEYEGVKYLEVIERHALDDADMSDVIMQYDHQGRVRARTSNVTLFLEPDNHGLFNYGDLSRSSAARELHEDIASKLITRMSWAFTVSDDEYDKANHTRIINKVKKVYDVSAVSMPANDATEISARSYFDGVIEMELRESQERQKKLEIAKAKYFYFGGNK
jgi:hypothetical protein